ncbi:MAG: ActS/PrrB/RegB family redox-sensitive histidine kinase [Phreatobacter sp.]
MRVNLRLNLLTETTTWRRSVRLETLIRLRWFAIAGQTAAILSVFWGLDSSLPIEWCLIAVGASAWLNISLRLRYPANHRLAAPEAGASLAWDILQLAFLLFLTGGLENPFAFLFLAPVLISATSLPPRMTLSIGALAVVCASVVAFVHLPLPWEWRDDLRLPTLYLVGVWAALVLCISFIGLYAWQVAEESRQFTDALAATELVLARELHLSQLDGLAAAAAHELGTPLATIALVTKELAGELPKDGPIGEDMALLGEQVKRCRDILAKLKSLSGGDAPFDTMPLAQLIEEVVQPHRFFDVNIAVDLPPSGVGEPLIRRNPAVLYGLGNIVENAVDFARSAVEIKAHWDNKEVAVTIADDGPGFPPDIVDRIGEPYLTRRGKGRGRRAMDEEQIGEEPSGMGLGMFIAKTLLERSGARATFRNKTAPETGAIVEVVWPRAAFGEGLADPVRRPLPAQSVNTET